MKKRVGFLFMASILVAVLFVSCGGNKAETYKVDEEITTQEKRETNLQVSEENDPYQEQADKLAEEFENLRKPEDVENRYDFLRAYMEYTAFVNKAVPIYEEHMESEALKNVVYTASCQFVPWQFQFEEIFHSISDKEDAKAFFEEYGSFFQRAAESLNRVPEAIAIVDENGNVIPAQ